MSIINPVPIEDIKFSIKDLEQQIYIGPQKELLDKVKQFNNTYNTDIGVTKTYRWKPGSFDKVKNTMNKMLKLNKKTSSMYQLTNRAIDSIWYLKRLRDNITALENTKCEMARRGIQWQDNTELINQCISHFLSSIKDYRDYNTDDINLSVLYVSDLSNGRYSGPSYYVPHIQLNITKSNFDMNLKIYDSDSDETDELGVLPIDGTVTLKLFINLHKYLTKVCDSMDKDNNVDMKKYLFYIVKSSVISRLYGEYKNNYHLRFPYIRDFNDPWSYPCLGDYNLSISKAASMFDFGVLLRDVNNWMTEFVVHRTAPLNQLKLTFRGLPEHVANNNIMSNVIGSFPADQCSYPNMVSSMGNAERIDHELYCIKFNCTYINSCAGYDRMNPDTYYPQREAYIGEFMEILHEHYGDLLTYGEIEYAFDMSSYPLSDKYDILSYFKTGDIVFAVTLLYYNIRSWLGLSLYFFRDLSDIRELMLDIENDEFYALNNTLNRVNILFNNIKTMLSNESLSNESWEVLKVHLNCEDYLRFPIIEDFMGREIFSNGRNQTQVSYANNDENWINWLERNRNASQVNPPDSYQYDRENNRYITT